jgi:hypothetical protein
VEQADIDSFRLESIGELHAVATEMFIPFAVVRLQRFPKDTETELTVEMRGIRPGVSEKRRLWLTWDSESVPPLPLAIQDNSITEWAALGVASAIIWHYARLRLHAVAVQGDRFGYWTMQGDREFGLEVSGTISADVESRHREKVQQLRDNPYGSDGYVVVVGFTTSRVVFSYHRFDEESP